MGDTAPGGIVGKSRGSPLRGGAEQGAGGRSGRAHPHPGRCSRPVSTAESRSYSRAGSHASGGSQERPLCSRASSSAGLQRMNRFVNKGSGQAPEREWQTPRAFTCTRLCM